MKEFLFTKLNVMTVIYTTLVKQGEHFKKVIKKHIKANTNQNHSKYCCDHFIYEDHSYLKLENFLFL